MTTSTGHVQALCKLLSLAGDMKFRRYACAFLGGGFEIRTTVPDNPGIHNLIAKASCDQIHVTLADCQLKVDISEEIAEIRGTALTLLMD
jgi:hypothetical protein